tara:strand:- start:1038 stop:1847 length:810 start_codon:yes stop_codon:yes gene_type:complete
MINLNRKVLGIPLLMWIFIILLILIVNPFKKLQNKVVENNRNTSNVEVHVFYAPWCGWSKKLMGEKCASGNFSKSPYEEVKKWCDQKGIKCIAHNSEKEKVLTEKMRISGLPTILLIEGDRKKTLSGFAPSDVFINTVQKFVDDKSFMDYTLVPKPDISKGKKGKLTCFYTPWCGWSKKMFGDKLADGDFKGSEFEKVKLEANKMNIEVEAVNGEKNTELTQTFGVDGFPTCWLQYGDGKEKEFGGFMPADNMIQELKNLVFKKKIDKE